MIKVFINPGHGQKANGIFDPGAVGPGGYQEAVNTKAIGTLLQKKLSAVAEIYLYQHGDMTPVCQAANNWGAGWFVSLHCNGSVSANAHGIETYCYQFGGHGQKLARSVQTQLIRKLGRLDRGIKQGNFQVLRTTNMPAILAEIGFITNPQEEALMQTAQWQENAAEALAVGISDYVGLGYQPQAEAGAEKGDTAKDSTAGEEGGADTGEADTGKTDAGSSGTETGETEVGAGAAETGTAGNGSESETGKQEETETVIPETGNGQETETAGQGTDVSKKTDSVMLENLVIWDGTPDEWVSRYLMDKLACPGMSLSEWDPQTTRAKKVYKVGGPPLEGTVLLSGFSLYDTARVVLNWIVRH